ncbi:MAG: hypothetical protein K9H26_19115 [Prolixibacteraceae bacterium]|nr:hypothetical protein [Prolixibacteraceae bacterium]
MKKYLFILTFLLSFSVYSQPRVGFQLGATVFNDLDEVMYINKTLSFGGELGINATFPLLKNKLAIETAFLFYNDLYMLRGPHVMISVDDGYSGGTYVYKNISTNGFSLPVNLLWNKGVVRPFIGATNQLSISPNENEIEPLGDISKGNMGDPDYIHAYGNDTIEMAAFTWYINAGVNIVLSPRATIKLQYALGMNDFVTHKITPKIVNDVNYGTTVNTTRINKYKVAFIYYPDWGRKRQKTPKATREKDKRPLGEKLKEFYQ